jgi:hypothetical protein
MNDVGRPYIDGWKESRNGMVTAVTFTNKRESDRDARVTPFCVLPEVG